MANRYFEGVGRRKEASARVRLHTGGTGNMTINDKPAEEYLSQFRAQDEIMRPLELVGQPRAYDVTIKVQGGGVNGQIEAMRLGVARALLEIDEEQFRPMLRQAGLLTRDPRTKERKKPGLKRARKAPTYTKR
ncbi:MAG: 30S ribosomal protein S9 [Anaerolineae bacterium]|nr:30S ribosomal protein S9 [Anaerolineae bacterium]